MKNVSDVSTLKIDKTRHSFNPERASAETEQKLKSASADGVIKDFLPEIAQLGEAEELAKELGLKLGSKEFPDLEAVGDLSEERVILLLEE